MDFNQAQIQGLTMDEIAGVISEEEKAYLHEVVANNKEAYAIWQELHNSIGPRQLQKAREGMRIEEPYEIVRAVSWRRRKTTIVQSALITIILFFTGIEIWYYSSTYLSERRQTSAIVPPNFPKPPDNIHIWLQLENGKAYNLSLPDSEIQTGAITLINFNDTLRYKTSGNVPGQARLTVPPGKSYNIVLSDRSHIQLNAASQLTFPIQFTDTHRAVFILGEAYFIVAASPDYPFFVQLPRHNSVQALGTEFNINAYDTGIVRIALIKGAVKIVGEYDSTILKPGYEKTLAADHRLKDQQFSEDTLLSWRTDIHEFGRATPLKEMCLVLPRFYGIKVIMDNKTVAEKLFSGTLDRNKPIQHFIENVKVADNSIQTYFDADSTLHFK